MEQARSLDLLITVHDIDGDGIVHEFEDMEMLYVEHMKNIVVMAVLAMPEVMKNVMMAIKQVVTAVVIRDVIEILCRVIWLLRLYHSGLPDPWALRSIIKRVTKK